MGKIFLHIGTFKTGSTALQFDMHLNRRCLLENGFYYGDYFDNYYLHSNLCYGLLKEALVEEGMYEKYKSHPRFLHVAENPDDIIANISKHSLENMNIIISSEAFFADAFRTLVGLHTILSVQEKRKINTYMRKRLRELLFSLSDQVVIVCYLRRQDLFIEAQYNQYCKNIWYSDRDESLPEFEEFVMCNPIELNYFTVLEEWREIFDTAEFIVKPYEKNAFRKDLISDFYTDILGINVEEVNHFKKIDRKQGNHRLDRDILEYKKYMDIRNGKINQLLTQYCENLEKVKDYAYFNKSERTEFMDRYYKQNAMVAKNYLHKGNGQLFENVDYEIPVYEGLEMKKVRKITQWLLNELV